MSELFNDPTPAETPASLADLVGEGKRYRDEAALAKAITEKDAFIERLKEEAAEARAELRARLNLEELADKVLTRKPTEPVTPPTNRNEPPLVKEEPAPSDLASEVRRLLKEEKAREDRTANLNKSIAALQEAYGPDYQQALAKAAQSLGVSKEYLTEMASTTPDGFTRLVTATVTPDTNVPVTPPVSSTGVQPDPKHSSKKNAAYYNELRRNDPKKYFSKAIQNEMYKSAKELGDAFFS